MILPDLFLFSRINQRWDYNGIDDPARCPSLEHFKSYPWPVSYCYNSRGFRDNEWPCDLPQLKSSIWCLGDSFTLGIGSSFEHTWPCVLQQNTGTRTINVSLDGASNNWIARKAQQVISLVEPKYMVIHWSYISRREKSFDQSNFEPWNEEKNSDETRRLESINSTTEQDIENTLACIDLVDHTPASTKIIHSFIPNFAPVGQGKLLESQIKGTFIPEFARLDWARDRHHYDIKTSRFFVEQIMQFLS